MTLARRARVARRLAARGEELLQEDERLRRGAEEEEEPRGEDDQQERAAEELRRHRVLEGVRAQDARLFAPGRAAAERHGDGPRACGGDGVGHVGDADPVERHQAIARQDARLFGARAGFDALDRDAARGALRRLLGHDAQRREDALALRSALADDRRRSRRGAQVEHHVLHGGGDRRRALGDRSDDTSTSPSNVVCAARAPRPQNSASSASV